MTVKDTKTAELCKLLDNAYRMTRFGFAADVATIAVENGIDAYEAINAAIMSMKEMIFRYRVLEYRGIA